MSASPPPPPTPPSSTRFSPYRQALQALSTRTGTALPSLIVSFAVLHELTAVVPIVGFFFGARALGVGERVVRAVASTEDDGSQSWAKARCREWMDEGGQWAQRVGRRYGVFGYEKKDRNAALDHSAAPTESEISSRLAGDAANAILAYGLTKALLPVRIGFSLYLAPAFSRRIVDPLQRTVLSSFRRRSS